MIDTIGSAKPIAAGKGAAMMTMHAHHARSAPRNSTAAAARRIAVVLCALLALLPAVHANAAILQGEVIVVDDGDSFVLVDSSGARHRGRIAGIDAPERYQPFSNRARRQLSRLVLHKPVTFDWYKEDQYGRRIGKLSADGRDAGLEQLRAGLAWHYKSYEGEQHMDERASYKSAEDEARKHKRGLWEQDAPLPPWEYRRQHSSR